MRIVSDVRKEMMYILDDVDSKEMKRVHSCNGATSVATPIVRQRILLQPSIDIANGSRINLRMFFHLFIDDDDLCAV